MPLFPPLPPLAPPPLGGLAYDPPGLLAVDHAGKLAGAAPLGEPCAAGDPLYISADFQFMRADAANPQKANPFSIATEAGGIGDLVPVTAFGFIQGLNSGSVAGQPIYLADGGGMSNTPGSIPVTLGVAFSPTSMLARIEQQAPNGGPQVTYGQLEYLFNNVSQDGFGAPLPLTVTNVPQYGGGYADEIFAPGESRVVAMDIRGLLMDPSGGYGIPGSNYFGLVASTDWFFKSRVASVAPAIGLPGTDPIHLTGIFLPPPIVGLFNFLLAIGVQYPVMITGCDISRNNGLFTIIGPAQGAPGPVSMFDLYLSGEPGMVADPNNGAISSGILFAPTTNPDNVIEPVRLVVTPRPGITSPSNISSLYGYEDDTWQRFQAPNLNRIAANLTPLIDGTALVSSGSNAPPLPICAAQTTGNAACVIVDARSPGVVVAPTGSKVCGATIFDQCATVPMGDAYSFGGSVGQELNSVPVALITRYDRIAGDWHGVWKYQESIVPVPTATAPAALNPAGAPGVPTLPYAASGGIYNLPAGTTDVPLDPAVFGDDTLAITPAISFDTLYILGCLNQGPFMGDQLNIYRGLYGGRLNQVPIDTLVPPADTWSYQSGPQTIRVNLSAPGLYSLAMTCRRLNAAPSAAEPDRLKRPRSLMAITIYVPAIDKIVVVGGLGTSGDPGVVTTFPGPDGTCAIVERFDPSTGLCTDGAALPAAIFDDPPCAVLHPDGGIYIFAGQDGGLGAGGIVSPTLIRYDPVADVAVLKTPPPIPVIRGMPPIVLPSGLIFLCGGTPSNIPPGSYHPSLRCWLYDPAADTYLEVGSMPTPATAIRAFLSAAGRVVVLTTQGEQSFRFVGRTCMELDEVTLTWRTLYDAPQDAGVGWGSNNALLANGKALHVGGAQGTQRNYENWSPCPTGLFYCPTRS